MDFKVNVEVVRQQRRWGIIKKQCSKCKQFKGLEDFFKGKSLHGRRSQCKDCENKQKGYKKKIGKPKLLQIEIDGIFIYHKECGDCKLIKSLDDFYYSKNGLGNRKSECKTCSYKRVSDWIYKNKDRNLNNRNAWDEKNKDKLKLYYQNQKQETKKARYQRREAYKRNLPSTLTDSQLIDIMKRFNYSCCLTGDPDIHLDHFIALSTGFGGTVYENMVPLSSKLNLSKSNKNPLDWFHENKERFNLDENKFNELIVYLSEINKLSVPEYINYINGCYNRNLTKKTL